MKKIRVLQFGSSNGLFGAERWILALVRYCDRTVVDNIIMTIKDASNSPIDLIERAREMGFNTDIVYAKGPYDPRTIFRTVSLIRKHKIDIVHTHGYKSDIIGYLAARLTGIPVISTPHGSELSIDPKLNLYQRVGDWFLKMVDQIVPVSDGLEKEYRGKGFNPDKIKMIRNGLDILEVQGVRPSIDFMADKSEKDVRFIGYVGQLIERKGLHNLIKAMKIITSNIKAKLLLTGEGKVKEDLKKIVENNGLSDSVVFLGFRTDRLEIMKCFDVFVLPSYLEGLPRVIMEAMAAEVPVIASDIPGVREIVHHNKTGILVPVDSPEQLADAIITLLENREKADELRKNAFSYVNERHSAERMAKDYCKLYKSIIDRTH